ncbi:helix-turn-helix domain-containing protein [Nocardia asiatica]|uniref:helix-turn-helix domain-containing protein n=1 Tax=Nocardia asiatica TaxID=209252 RepID=UPI0024539701|nr:helix-turn-helix domain-containing protein [Nocardia asiatica]
MHSRPPSTPSSSSGERRNRERHRATDDDIGDETWLSTEEVAHRLKIPAKTLSAWAAAGRGPRFARMGRYRRYRVSDLLAWEENQLANGGGSGTVST